MASSSEIRAGRAFIELYAKNQQLEKDLNKSESDTKGWGSSLGAVFKGLSSVGGGIGFAISKAFDLIESGAKIAAAGIAGVGAAAAGLAVSFSNGDRAFMSPEQVENANALHESFALLGDGATALRNTLGSALTPAFQGVIDIMRLGLKAVRDWVNAHPELIAAVNQFVGGIRDALSNGDIALAAKIAWAGIKAGFLSGMAGIVDSLNAWKPTFIGDWFVVFANAARVVDEFAINVLDSFGAVLHSIKEGWLNLKTFGETVFIQLGLQDLDKDEGQAQADRRKRLEADVAKLDADKDKFQKNIDDRRKAAEKGHEDALAAARNPKAFGQGILALIQQERDAAREELRRLQGVAKANAQAIAPDIPKAREFMTSVVGTFSGQALGGLGVGSGLASKQLDETKKGNEKLGNIVDAIRDLPRQMPGLVFG